MNRAIWTYAQDLVERGADDALDELRRCGFDAVSLAAVYHSVQAYLPENPRRRWLTTLRSAEWFREPFFVTAADAVHRSGLDLIAWLVLCHSSLATDRPDLAVRPAAGGPMPGALCPAQPEVQERLVALAVEVDERFAPAALDLETPGWMPFPHHHHGKLGAELGAGQRLAAWICVCDACARFGAREAQERLAAGSFDDAITQFLRIRAGVVTQLVADIEQAVRARVRVAHWGEPRGAGIDYRAIGGTLTVLAYTDEPDTLESIVAPVVEARGAGRTAVGLTLCHPEMSDEAALRACLARCTELGVDAVSFYNHSLVDRARLHWATP